MEEINLWVFTTKLKVLLTVYQIISTVRVLVSEDESDGVKTGYERNRFLGGVKTG
ncbi:hypothetical protein Hanom_Chr03g00190421 [Helianthus anomalus]